MIVAKIMIMGDMSPAGLADAFYNSPDGEPEDQVVDILGVYKNEKELNENKKWGPFLKMKNALHQQVYDELQPLIRKKRRGEELTDADDEKLEDLDKQIFDRLIK